MDVIVRFMTTAFYGSLINPLRQGVQPNLVSGPQFFPVIWAAICQKPKENGQNSDFSLNSESSLGRTKIFLGRRLDTPALRDQKSKKLDAMR